MAMVGVCENLPLLTKEWWDKQEGTLWTQSEVLSRGWKKSQVDKYLKQYAYGRNPAGGAYVRLYIPREVTAEELTVFGKELI